MEDGQFNNIPKKTGELKINNEYHPKPKEDINSIIERIKNEQSYKILHKFKKFNILNEIENKIREENSLLKSNNIFALTLEYFPKPKPYSNNYYNDNETNLKESINRLFPEKEIIWKPCREILNTENVVILPNKIDNSNFNQGSIGDCYFISCINALSQIPQLLNFIMRLSSPFLKNKNRYVFSVNFFIDGKWKIIYVNDSFPVFKDSNELVGVQPKKNELFLMILEKAWAKINGGYDQIEGGRRINIFELFLGCKCDSFNHKKNNNNEINSLFKSIKENENTFGTLSLCGSETYEINDESILKDSKIYNKNEALNKGLITKKGNHSYKIVKTLEIYPLNKDYEDDKYNKYDTCKFLIISNPHGKDSKFIQTGVELKEIEKILEQKFGSDNKDQYQFILDKNEKYGYDDINNKNGTGIIYMPLEYFKNWSYNSTVCIPHYGCLSYYCNIKDELECLYIYKIKLNKSQLFTSQVCFQSFRAHRDNFDKVKVILNIGKESKIIKNELLLFYIFCGIKIIKNNKDNNNYEIIKNYFSYNDDSDKSSIKEINCSLEKGEYFIIIYPESSINEAVIRFLSEKEINIKLINKINKGELKNIYNYDSTEKIFKDIFGYHISHYKNYYYNELGLYLNFLKLKENVNLISHFKKEDFLPGIKEYYQNFRALAESKGLAPEDAIYSISQEGETFFYDIIDPYTMNKIYGQRKINGITKYDIIDVNTIQFRDSLGYPYKVNNYRELFREMKANKEPMSCLFSEYDENTNTLNSGEIHLKFYYNRATNEDILVITDKRGKKKERNQSPLFIIIIDISGSMSEYQGYLQNKLIPKLLRKLGYIWEKKEIYDILIEKKIKKFEILQAISSKIKMENFLNRYNLKNKLNPKHLKNFCNDIIPLITFSDDSELYFFDTSDFDKCYLSGGGTYFQNAAYNLCYMLKYISRERSIRLLTFSDGEISDSEESKRIMDLYLNSGKTRHQMNSVSVRVCHGTEPDTQILMKLSSFSHPICDMTQIVINPDEEKNIDKVVEKLYKLFENDGMIYSLKLYSDIFMMSNEFSNKFSREQCFNEKIVLRTNSHRSKSEYENILKIYNGKLTVEDCGELYKHTFYDNMLETAPYIAQRILERKVNKKDNLEENQEIINYFKETELYFENKGENNLSFNEQSKNENIKKKKIYELFQEINENNDIYKMNPNQLSEYINKIKEEAIEIIRANQIEFENDINNNNSSICYDLDYCNIY